MSDFGEVAALLHIYKEAHAHGDALQNIKAAAWERLKTIDAEHKAAKEPEPEPEPEVEADDEIEQDEPENQVDNGGRRV